MKSQVFLTTIFVAASVATVESLHLPNHGKPSNTPSLSSSQQKKDPVTNDIANRYLSFASKQMNQKKDTTSSDIASKYMSFATGAAPKNREPVVSTWKKEDNVKKESSSSTPSKLAELLNFDISSSKQEATDIQESAKASKSDFKQYHHVSPSNIDEWSTALKELEDLRRGGQQVYTNLYNFEDSWQ